MLQNTKENSMFNKKLEDRIEAISMGLTLLEAHVYGYNKGNGKPNYWPVGPDNTLKPEEVVSTRLAALEAEVKALKEAK